MPGYVDHRALYRLPWNLADNPIAWLEPTQACNLACDGCYRQNVKDHKSMEVVQDELDTFARLRNFDGVSIAGGDPLTHPQVVEIVRRVAAMGRKPIINTNGLALTEEMLRDLKAAGLIGLTFHVDSKQGRPSWRDKTEKQTNDLRQYFVDMVDRVGDLAVAFNSTVYEDTLEQVPDVLEWGEKNLGKVHTLVFIVYRAAKLEQFDYFANGKKIDMGELVYTIDAPRKTDLTSRDVVDSIRKRFPDFEPCSYLNGTEKPDSLKWLVSLRFGQAGKVYGYAGPKFMETTQSLYHLFAGRYLSYAPASTLSMGRSVFATSSLFDGGVRQAAARFVRTALTNPLVLAKDVHVQTTAIIQPIDVLEDGRQNMCDGCPDMTIWDGRLAWSCRLEENRNFGTNVYATPKTKHLPVAAPKGLAADGRPDDAS